MIGKELKSMLWWLVNTPAIVTFSVWKKLNPEPDASYDRLLLEYRAYTNSMSKALDL